MHVSALLAAQLAGKLAGGGVGADQQVLVISTIGALTTAHAVWSLRLVLIGLRFVIGGDKDLAGEDIADIHDTITLGRDDLIEAVRGSEGAYERARSHHWRNSRRAYAFGAAGGALIMLAGIDAAAAGPPKWTEAAAVAAAALHAGAAGAFWYRTTADDGRTMYEGSHQNDLPRGGHRRVWTLGRGNHRQGAWAARRNVAPRPGTGAPGMPGEDR